MIPATATVLVAILAASILPPSSPLSNMSLVASLKDRLRRSVAKNLRSPSDNEFTGWLMAKLMKASNTVNNHEMIDILLQEQNGNLKAATPSSPITLVELGPGNGMSMEYLLNNLLQDKQVDNSLEIHGFEISERFQSILRSKFPSEIQSGLLTIHSNDAKEIERVLLQQQSAESSNIHSIYGTNVVYFLHPLDEYLIAFNNILAPGGLLLFGVQNAVQNFEGTNEFINTKWETVMAAMRDAGFVKVKQQASAYPGEGEQAFYLMGRKVDK